MRRQVASISRLKAGLGGVISSNPQQTMASNLRVSSSRKLSITAAMLCAACAILPANATPTDAGMSIPAPTLRYVPVQLSGRAPNTMAANPRRTFDRLGPQATERAVRSSLKTALVPDPLAMAALIFCAFALRWMRLQKSQRVALVASPQAA